VRRNGKGAGPFGKLRAGELTAGRFDRFGGFDGFDKLTAGRLTAGKLRAGPFGLY